MSFSSRGSFGSKHSGEPREGTPLLMETEMQAHSQSDVESLRTPSMDEEDARRVEQQQYYARAAETSQNSPAVVVRDAPNDYYFGNWSDSLNKDAASSKCNCNCMLLLITLLLAIIIIIMVASSVIQASN